MRILTAVFSFNRGQLLANCLRSLQRFQPGASIVVFDDASDDAGTLEVLAQMAGPTCEVLTTRADEKAHHGNLYVNMNRAVTLAAARGFEFVHFVQDDTQLLWQRPDLEAHAAAIMAADGRAVQMQVHFLKRLGRSKTTPLPNLRAYRVRTPGGDLGIFHVQRLIAHGVQFGPTEQSWGALGREKDLRVYATADSIVARIPWPKSARFGHMRGNDVLGAAQMLLCPLDAADLSRLLGRDIEKRPLWEDWARPNGWRCWQPYQHDPSVTAWLLTIARTAVQRRSMTGLWPRRVGSDLRDETRPTECDGQPFAREGKR